MTNPSFMRHAAFFGPEDQQVPICIIGVGAAGSYVGLMLAKMGCTKFKIWDADIVESHNLPNQAYDAEHIGLSKVEAFTKVLKRFNPDVQIEAHPTFFESKNDADALEGIVILTVDTMHARKDIGNILSANWRIKQVFETRLGFDFGEVNCLEPFDLERINAWHAGMKSDDEVPDGPCNQRICPDLVNVVASYISRQVCGMLSAERRQVQYIPKNKVVFELNDDHLSTWQI
jgi:predicted ThiF/HesA family dinucleotide-utilizing enzyme